MRSSALPVSHTTDRFEAVTILRLARMLNFIKSLIDRNEKLPEPEPFSQQYKIEIQNRHKSGLQLLKWFLADGKIRGITREGDIYEHHVSERLAQKFIKELDLIKVRGVKYLNY